MCLRTTDLKVKNVKHNCYLTHPKRDEDLDDVLLDCANQLELSKTDLVQWVTSPRSWFFIETEPEPEVSDFVQEFDACA